MPIFFTSLNSGSNGNCYYVGNGNDAVLIDVGISCREVERRMHRLGLNLGNVRAILVSHEHGDHITGIPALSKKYRLPVYITQHTFRSASIPIEPGLMCPFKANEVIRFGNLTVTPFVKFHDAADPHSFVVEQDGVRVGIFTDIGIACKQVVRYFRLCDAVFLEANYCEDMLQKGNYPYFLKERIRGGNGHLSNAQALELFNKHKGKQLRRLILSHLSKNNNCPELVDRLFNEHAGEVSIVVASRYKETELYCIEEAIQGVNEMVDHRQPVQMVQLSLF